MAIESSNSENEILSTDLSNITDDASDQHATILEVVTTLESLSHSGATVLLAEMVPRPTDSDGSDTTINFMTPVTFVTSTWPSNGETTTLDQSGLHSLAEAVTLEQVLSETRQYTSEQAACEDALDQNDCTTLDEDFQEGKNVDITEENNNVFNVAVVQQEDDIDEILELTEDKERKTVSIGIQACDGELEQCCRRLPSRRITLPSRFRDIEDNEADEKDKEYKPGDDIQNIQKQKKKKGPGRPKKYPPLQDNCETKKSEENKEISSAVEQGTEVVVINKAGKKGKTSSCNFRCGICGKRFSQKGNLKTHLRTHSDECPFNCDLCPKSFKSQETLNRHQVSHSGIKPFHCEVCNQRFSSAVSLKEHQARHTNEKPYQCSACNRFFRQTSCLRRHLVTHTNSQPFPCGQCGRRFSQMVYLRSHMRTHTGEKPFSCSVCSRSFSHQSDLNRHKVIHSGTKPYSCSVCQASFSDPSSRRRHIKEHYGIKAFICQLCGDGFKRAGQLKAHIYKKHNNELSDVTILKLPNDKSLKFVFKCGIRFKTVQNFDQPFFDCEDIEMQTNSEIVENGSGELITTENEQIQLSINEISKDDDKLAEKSGNNNSTVEQSLENENQVTVMSQHMSVEALQQVLNISANSDYVLYPAFNCQNYYNWLSNFTTLCKLVPIPIDPDLFTKISQVHKSLSDVLATPSGVLSNKDNFKILMSISKDLHEIINAHLTFVLDNLDGQEKE